MFKNYYKLCSYLDNLHHFKLLSLSYFILSIILNQNTQTLLIKIPIVYLCVIINCIYTKINVIISHIVLIRLFITIGDEL